MPRLQSTNDETDYRNMEAVIQKNNLEIPVKKD